MGKTTIATLYIQTIRKFSEVDGKPVESGRTHLFRMVGENIPQEAEVALARSNPTKCMTPLAAMFEHDGHAPFWQDDSVTESNGPEAEKAYLDRVKSDVIAAMGEAAGEGTATEELPEAPPEPPPWVATVEFGASGAAIS